jgi:hypothetical protein
MTFSEIFNKSKADPKSEIVTKLSKLLKTDLTSDILHQITYFYEDGASPDKIATILFERYRGINPLKVSIQRTNKTFEFKNIKKIEANYIKMMYDYSDVVEIIEQLVK